MSQNQGSRPLHICYFGTYRANYTRNQILLKGLATQPNVVVHTCHATLWHSIEDRVAQASGGWRKPRFWWRVLKTYWQLIRTHNRTPNYDVMLIGYPGQFDAYLARLLTWWRRKPMALDILMSLHLVAEERGLTDKNPFTGRLIFWLEKGGLKLPNLLISENGAYEAYYCQKYNLPPERFRRVPHGADETVYAPRPFQQATQVAAQDKPLQPPSTRFRVTYHGTYLPSHGMDAIIGAAKKLHHQQDIQFHFYGTGPEKERIEQFVRQNELTNVIFHGHVSREELLDGLAQAHICLGVFGQTKQSHYTIQNKLWEGLAMDRPVLSGDSGVVREALTHGEHIYLVERDSSQAVADGILVLKDDPVLREKIAQQGYQQFLTHNSTPAIGRATVNALRTMLK